MQGNHFFILLALVGLLIDLRPDGNNIINVCRLILGFTVLCRAFWVGFVQDSGDYCDSKKEHGK